MDLYMVNHLPSKVLRILFAFSMLLIVSLQKKKENLKIELKLTFAIKTENPCKYSENYQPIHIINMVSACPGENMEGDI